MLVGAQGLKKTREEMRLEVFQKPWSASEASADQLQKSGAADSLLEDKDEILRQLSKLREHLFYASRLRSGTGNQQSAGVVPRPVVVRGMWGVDNLTPRGAEAYTRIASVPRSCV